MNDLAACAFAHAQAPARTATDEPRFEIKRFVFEGRTAAEIARHFNVSRALVEYRIKISRLWGAYKDHIFTGPSA